MVIESIVEIVLSKYLDKFFYGINSKNIQIALLDGKFTLSNIGLQPNFFLNFNLPIELEYSYVEKLELVIPWRKDEVSLQINITNIYALLNTRQDFDLYNIFMKKKEAVIEQVLKDYKQSLNKRQNKDEPGAIEKYLIKLLDNVNIRIDCIHIRYESIAKNFSFGLQINEIRLKTVNKDDEQEFFNRQKSTESFVRYILDIDFIGIYFNSKETSYLSKKSYAWITQEMNKISTLRIPEFKPADYESQDTLDSFQYILRINFKTYLKKYIDKEQTSQSSEKQQENQKFEFQCSIKLNSIESKISHSQYYDILEVIDFFTWYQSFWYKFVSHRELTSEKEKNTKDISQLLRKKKIVSNKQEKDIGRKQKDTIKRNCRKYITWLFSHTYQLVLKNKFIVQAIKKEVTLRNLLENPKTLAIMRKIDNEKLKQWVLISLHYRSLFEEKINILFRSSSDRIQAFNQKYLRTNEDFYCQVYEFQQEFRDSREESKFKEKTFLKVKVFIKDIYFEISEEGLFGVSFKLKKLREQITTNEKNYLMNLSMQDFEADVFSSKKGQKLKTYVPIIKRNWILEDDVNLLELTLERNPIGKPAIYAEINATFESIEITIYPEAFKQFYQILLGDSELLKKKNKNKKKELVQENLDRNVTRAAGVQKTIIKAQVKSPWILLPLSQNNDLTKQCWVVRLGDFYIDTPEVDYSAEVYYEKYKLQLKNFEISYFSSINYFHNWQKFNYSTENLSKLKAYANEKIIVMIAPFSCFVDFSWLKKYMPSTIKEQREKMVAKVMIKQIQIKVSQFLLTKMKYRFDLFGESTQEGREFIETNVVNIREENEMAGFCKINYERLRQARFYCILKGNYMYFFLNENIPKYHFFVDLRELSIRLISNDFENFNEDKSKIISIYILEEPKFSAWRKKIFQVISRKDRKIDNNLAASMRLTSTFLPKQNQTKNRISTDFKKKQSTTENNEEEVSDGGTKVNFEFIMNRLSIELIDANEEKLLHCDFKRASFTYKSLLEKEMEFKLNEWIVTSSNNATFLSSCGFFEEDESDEKPNQNNFLQMQIKFNQITGELRDIFIHVDKVFIAWKVQLFTKILLFFYYEEEVGDAPAPINNNKRTLEIKLDLKKFDVYCYQEDMLEALIKFQYVTICYFQSNVQEYYDINCKIFEMDKYMGIKRTQHLPMITRKINHFSSKENIHSQNTHNQFKLFYLIRKNETQDFPNICALKESFGQELLVSELTCQWENSNIYFENQLTFRLLNYVLNKILGTVANKFKKRQFSQNYVFELLKIKKITTFDVKLSNITFLIPSHSRQNSSFELNVDEFRVSKNIDSLYWPKIVKVPTARDNIEINFFYEDMVFEFKNIDMRYRFGKEEGIKIHEQPFDIEFTYSKVNFQKQFYVILKHEDDVDRKGIISVGIAKAVAVNLHKIMFITFLQIFYQNIKHKDGRADLFETPLPFPTLRNYTIKLSQIELKMLHFSEETNSMLAFLKAKALDIQISYEQIGSKSKIVVTAKDLFAEGEIPIFCLNQKLKHFSLQMHSEEGEMKVIIKAQHYGLKVNLDLLNNLFEFINYDSEYVANQIMPKKSPSWQYINVFAKHCQIQLASLHADGEFYISYLKGMRNDLSTQACQYLFDQPQMPELMNWDNIVDKEIKVNGEGLTARIEGDEIARVSSFYFNRIDVTNRLNNRKYKQEQAQVGEGIVYVQLNDLKTIWSAYNSNIRKSPDFVLKEFYQPWNSLANKQKPIEKRRTQAEIEKLSIFILPIDEKSPELFYGNVILCIPSIVYKTFKDQQEICIRIAFEAKQLTNTLQGLKIAECQDVRIRYINLKDKKLKQYDILNAKNIRLYLHRVSSQITYQLIQELKNKSILPRRILNYDSQYKIEQKAIIKISNNTNRPAQAIINKCIVIQVAERTSQQYSLDAYQLIQLFTKNTTVVFSSKGNSFFNGAFRDISLNKATDLSSSLVLRFRTLPNGIEFELNHCFLITNKSQVSFELVEIKKMLHPCQSVSFQQIESGKGFGFCLKMKGSDERHELIGKEEVQLICNGWIQVGFKQEGVLMEFTIRQRYVIKNCLPFDIEVNNNQVSYLQEEVLLWSGKKCKTNAFSILVNQNMPILIDLTCQKHPNLQVPLQELVNSSSLLKESSEKLIEIIVKAEEMNGIKKLYLGCKNIFRNFTNTKLLYSENDQTVYTPLLENEMTILANDTETINILDENNQVVKLHLKKDKEVSQGEWLLRKETAGKVIERSIFTIESKFTIYNQTNNLSIKVISSQKEELTIERQSWRGMASHVVGSDFRVGFCDESNHGYYRKMRIDVGKSSICYVELDGQFYKVSLLVEDKSIRLIIQNSKTAYAINNQTQDLVITARADGSPQHQLMHQSSMLELSSEDDDLQIERVIKPRQIVQIGFFQFDCCTLTFEFYYDLKNIDFKQKCIIDLKSMSEQRFSRNHVVRDEKDQKICFSLIITVERGAEHQFQICIYRQAHYQEMPIDHLRLNIEEVSLQIQVTSNPQDTLTFELFQVALTREKGIENQEIDLQIQQFLVREGTNSSIINSLNSATKFLDFQGMLSKTLTGTGARSILMKIAPFEINIREKIMFKLLEKIAHIRSFKTIEINRKQKNNRATYGRQMSSEKIQNEIMSESQMPSPNLNQLFSEQSLAALQKLKKGHRVLVVDSLQICESCLFISYSKDQYTKFDETLSHDPIIKYSLLIPSISQLKIAIPGIKIEHFEGELKQFGKHILQEMKQSLGGTVMNSFSSLSLFDSPVIAADSLYKYILGILVIQ